MELSPSLKKPLDESETCFHLKDSYWKQNNEIFSIKGFGSYYFLNGSSDTPPSLLSQPIFQTLSNPLIS